MTKDEQMALMGMVSKYASDVGLCGVLILSPRCDDCGNCHDFSLMSDAIDDDMVAGLLERFVEVCRNDEAEMVNIGRAKQ